ncbi:hypothetical protein PhaeoP78_03543 (plasmid) [Phaeobacter inhibens]|nr:hypothetical protein PhaeoP78_03543 [Phaeobacter inhibens]
MANGPFDPRVQLQILLIQRPPCVEQRDKGMCQNIIHFDDRTHDTIKLPCETDLGRRMPNIFNNPRVSFARSIVFLSNALRMLSSARRP